MRRRHFITLLGGAAAGWPLGARAQQTLPVVGFLYSGSPAPMAPYLAAFLRTLAEAGYVENQTVAIDYRFAEGRYETLPLLAADLVRRQVAVIVAAPNTNAARAAIAAGGGIPIVFNVSDDPVKLGLVASLNRPGGNATGVNSFMSEVVAKRLGLLREFLPAAARFGALVNPSAATTEAFIKDFTAAAGTLNVQFEIVQARDDHEIEVAFDTLARNKNERAHGRARHILRQPQRPDRHRGDASCHSRRLHGARLCGAWRAHELRAECAGYVPSTCNLRRSHSQGREARRSTCGAVDQTRPRSKRATRLVRSVSKFLLLSSPAPTR